MPQEIFYILVTALIGAVITAIGWVLVMLINGTQKNTLAMVTLTLEIQYLREAIKPIPEMEKDITMAHEKIRDLEKKRGN